MSQTPTLDFGSINMWFLFMKIAALIWYVLLLTKFTSVSIIILSDFGLSFEINQMLPCKCLHTVGWHCWLCSLRIFYPLPPLCWILVKLALKSNWMLTKRLLHRVYIFYSYLYSYLCSGVSGWIRDCLLNIFGFRSHLKFKVRLD